MNVRADASSTRAAESSVRHCRICCTRTRRAQLYSALRGSNCVLTSLFKAWLLLCSGASDDLVAKRLSSDLQQQQQRVSVSVCVCVRKIDRKITTGAARPCRRRDDVFQPVSCALIVVDSGQFACVDSVVSVYVSVRPSVRPSAAASWVVCDVGRTAAAGGRMIQFRCLRAASRRRH